MSLIRIRLILVGIVLALVLTAIENVRAADVPKGEVTQYSFDQSKVFPGTMRDYWIYVPKQYDSATPACVFVCQDGIRFNATQVFDTLIERHEMPVTIGLFV